MSDPALPPRSRASSIGGAFAVLGGILCAFVLAEIISRALYANGAARTQNDPATGLVRSVPYSRYVEAGSCFSNTVQINRYGFYGPDLDPEKPSGTRRVVFVGNSFVESNQLPLEQGFA